MPARGGGIRGRRRDTRLTGLGPDKQVSYPDNTDAAGNWTASATTLHGDTSDQTDGTYVELTQPNEPSTMILDLAEHDEPNTTVPGGVIRLKWKEVTV